MRDPSQAPTLLPLPPPHLVHLRWSLYLTWLGQHWTRIQPPDWLPLNEAPLPRACRGNSGRQPSRRSVRQAASEISLSRPADLDCSFLPPYNIIGSNSSHGYVAIRPCPAQHCSHNRNSKYDKYDAYLSVASRAADTRCSQLLFFLLQYCIARQPSRRSVRQAASEISLSRPADLDCSFLPPYNIIGSNSSHGYVAIRPCPAQHCSHNRNSKYDKYDAYLSVASRAADTRCSQLLFFLLQYCIAFYVASRLHVIQVGRR